MGSQPPPDQALAGLAARQHGYVTWDQLRAVGLSREQIAHRGRLGSLIRVHRGVYAVGHLPLTPVAQASAAALACGPGAILSHGSAATLWKLQKDWHRPYEVTVAGDRRPKGIRVHRCRTLTTKDVTTHYGIRVTSPARTLLQIAPRLTEPALARAYNDGLLARYLREAHLQELLSRRANDPGAAALRHLVPRKGGPTRSELEDTFKAFLRRYGFPEPEMNVHVAGLLVDAWFPDHRLIIEIDSIEFHSGRLSFETDRNRDAIALEHGLATLRITHERMTETPDAEARRLETILERRATLT
jgi:very-short-patch-repair endonuclease